MSECEHDPPLALNNFNAIGTSVLYNFDFDNSVDELTATLVIAVDNVTLLYVGYSEGGEHFVAAVSDTMHVYMYMYAYTCTCACTSSTTAACLHEYGSEHKRKCSSLKHVV